VKRSNSVGVAIDCFSFQARLFASGNEKRQTRNEKRTIWVACSGKAVRDRHCPATVMRNEPAIKPLPLRWEGAG
jgi:hypothetical protein